MKTLGQIAYEKYAEFQLRIPRMEIRPLTWEELKLCNNGDICREWEEIAGSVRSEIINKLN